MAAYLPLYLEMVIDVPVMGRGDVYIASEMCISCAQREKAQTIGLGFRKDDSAAARSAADR